MYLKVLIKRPHRPSSLCIRMTVLGRLAGAILLKKGRAPQDEQLVHRGFKPKSMRVESERYSLISTGLVKPPIFSLPYLSEA